MASTSSATPMFSWTDTLNIAFSAASTSCMPSCLRRTPSHDSIQNHAFSTHHRSPPTSYDNSRPFDPNTINRIPRARPDELQGLLADTDGAAERLSLHSNPGRTRPKRKGKGSSNRKKNKKITLFGFDLFGSVVGRPKPPPIHLPDEDDVLYDNIEGSSTTTDADEDAGVAGSASRKKRGNRVDTPGPTVLTATTSIATFDSDAAPLSSSIIDELSSSTSAAALIAASEAESLAFQKAQEEKEEERRKRHGRRKDRKAQKELRERLERERMVLERLKLQGVLPESGNGEEFEGFQGSGSAAPAPAQTPSLSMAALIQSHRRRSSGVTTETGSTSTTSRSGSGSRSHRRSASREQFGPFVKATPPVVRGEDEEEEAAADLDGAMYSGKRRSYHGSTGSDSRSRASKTSASLSQAGVHHQQGPGVPVLASTSTSRHHHPLNDINELSTTAAADTPQKDEKKKKKNKQGHSSPSSRSRSHNSNSNASTSQSASLASPSPTSTGFGFAAAGAIHEDGDGGGGYQHHPSILSPSTIEQGLGFFDAEDLASLPPPSPAFEQGDNDGVRLERPTRRSEFPMAGFGLGGGGRKARDVARFLANRGDDEDDGVVRVDGL